MAIPKLQLLSRTQYDTDGTTTIWDFNFSGRYILQDHVKAYWDTPLGVRTPVTVTPAMLIGEWQLQITPAIPAGNVLTIYRATPKDQPMVDFVERGQISEVALDTLARQAIFVAAEASDDTVAANSDVAVNAAAEAQAAQAAAIVSATAAATQATAAAASATAASTSATAASTSAADAATTAAALTPLLGSTVVGRAVLKAVDALAARTAIGAAALSETLGVGQAWGVVTRTAGTTYYNTFPRPIVLHTVASGGSASLTIQISINSGTNISYCATASGTGPSTAQGSIIIPAGASYVLTETNVTSRTHNELR